jgi:hypothetical protein
MVDGRPVISRQAWQVNEARHFRASVARPASPERRDT